MARFIGIVGLKTMFQGVKPEDIKNMELDWCSAVCHWFSSMLCLGQVKDEVLNDPDNLVGRYAVSLCDRLEGRGMRSDAFEKELDALRKLPKWKKIDMRMYDHGPTSVLMRQASISKSDVGKMFIMSPDGISGKILAPEELQQANVDDIDGWAHIGELDVNC